MVNLVADTITSIEMGLFFHQSLLPAFVLTAIAAGMALISGGILFLLRKDQFIIVKVTSVVFIVYLLLSFLFVHEGSLLLVFVIPLIVLMHCLVTMVLVFMWTKRRPK